MTDYVKATDFAAKDALASGNPAKVVKGTEIDDEFEAIETAIGTKADLVDAALTGTPTAPTAATTLNTTQIATTAFVQQELNAQLPVGTTLLMGFSSPTPAGFLAADGSDVSRAGYPDLFTAIGTTFGTGDGSTTFGLPNPTPPTDMSYFIKY
jgi:hypothetical protein